MFNLLLVGMLLISLSLLAAFFFMGGKAPAKNNETEPEKVPVKKINPREFQKYYETENFESLTEGLDSIATLQPDQQRKLLELCSREEVVQYLVEQLSNKGYKQRVSACIRLGQIGSKKAARPLLEAVADKNEEVRLVATDALKKVNNQDLLPDLIDALRNSDKWLPARIAELITYFGSDAIPYLEGAIKDKNPVTRGYTIEILSEIGGEDIAYLLEKALDDPDAEVRLKAVRAIGNTVHENSREILVKMLGDSDIRVQIQALRALPKAHRRNVVDSIADKLLSKEPKVRNAAFDVLKHLGDDGFGKIKEIAFSDDHPMAEIAKEYLEELNKSEEDR